MYYKPLLLILQKADIAAAGLTITYARARVVDFSMPFLNLGITIIYKKPVDTPPDLFSFLLPLSPDVWIYMIAAYLCVSFMLFLVARYGLFDCFYLKTDLGFTHKII